ncbi:MAG: hypothetical protein HY055_00305 [Magnetospirillum sp.]|nr:hypothetical protein [Magnetospirillum sp.]
MNSEASPAFPADQTRPDNVPVKFWDPASGQVRIEALLRAYRDLERRSSAMAKPASVPADPALYQINTSHPALASDAGLNQRLHEAGFTQEQAQLLYDLAHERLLPMMEQMAATQGKDAELQALRQHFGGDARWQESARQIAAWGKANLPIDAYHLLASSAEGVKTMHRLMGSGEPSLGGLPAAKDEAPSEEQLKKMLSDPRYWKTKDPAFIAKVTDGFRRLYGED